MEAGIDSISLNPDSVVPVKRRVAAVEAKHGGRTARAAAVGAAHG